MPTPIDRAREARLKDAIEAALRDGFAPFRQAGGKGSAVAEGARRLREAGYTEIDYDAAATFVRKNERWKTRGVEHWLPDWGLFAAPGLPAQALKRGRVYRWIVTAAQDDTDVHRGFWTNLRAYAGYLKAELLIGGFTYQHAVHSDRQTLTATYREEIRAHLRFDSIDLGPVRFAAGTNILPTAVTPLTGMDIYSKGRDVIFPHATIQYVTLAAPVGDYVPSLMTTGCVTVPNYIEKKAGQRAREHHTLGATIVEVDESGAALCRQINAEPDGTFQDLDAVVSAGTVTRGNRIEAVVFGDIHWRLVEGDVFRWLWGRHADSLVDALRPKYAFYHDLLDFEQWSRHVLGDPLHRARMHYQGRTSMEAEVAGGAKFLRDTEREFCRSVVIESNHDDRLRQWARSAVDRMDTENARFWHVLNLAQLEAEARGDESFNLVRWALQQADARRLEAIEFNPMGQSYLVCRDKADGIECGFHGHAGPNGAKGSPRGFARMTRKTVRADQHSPSILQGAYTVGVTCALDAGYNRKAPSSWKRAHCLIYPNGKRTLITQAEDGRWKL